MTDQAIIIGSVREIRVGVLRIEHGIAGESSYRLLTIESETGDKFCAKLCGNEYGLETIYDEEMERFLEDVDDETLSLAERDYFDGKALEIDGVEE